METNRPASSLEGVPTLEELAARLAAQEQLIRLQSQELARLKLGATPTPGSNKSSSTFLPFRFMRRGGRFAGVGFITLILLSLFSTVALASIPASDGVISACYDTGGNNKGAVRIIDAATATCRRGETLLSWNQKGLQGLQGVKGDQGVPGLPGAPGPKGDTGPQGSGFRFRGLHDLYKVYDLNDVVISPMDHNTYISLGHIQTQDPAVSQPGLWQLFVPKGEKGDTGAQGPVGPQGPSGLSGYEIVTSESGFTTEKFKFWYASCSEGKKVIGGGAFVFAGVPVGGGIRQAPIALQESTPEGNSWVARALAFQDNVGEWDLIVNVICVNA